jgi:hypothetical protein
MHIVGLHHNFFPFYPFQTALLNIVLRDSFAAPEKDIFLALLNWCKHNSKEDHAEIMQAVRLPLMSLTELLNVVRPSGLLSPDAILDAIKVRSESRDMDLNYRGMLSKYLFIYPQLTSKWCLHLMPFLTTKL